MIQDIYTIQHVTLIQKGDGKRSNRDQSLTKKFDIFSPCEDENLERQMKFSAALPILTCKLFELQKWSLEISINEPHLIDHLIEIRVLEILQKFKS